MPAPTPAPSGAYRSAADLRAALRYIAKDGLDDRPWCVYSKDGQRIACHATEAEAEAQLGAIEAAKQERAQRQKAAGLEPPPHAPPTLTLEGEDWILVLGDEVLAADSRAEAFELVEASDWFADVTARKHVDKWDGLADGRWIDAASVEDMPLASDGSQIRAEMIDEMAANLASDGTPIQVDGGGISEVHESVWNTAAKAAGRGFAAVRVIGEDARPHLWLWVRLLPEVDDAVEQRQLSFGSIAFLEATADRYTGEPIGARLLSYALTNEPCVDHLEPHAPRETRSQRTAGAPETIVLTRSRRALMAQHTTLRGPAKDKLEAVASKLGMTVDETLDDPFGELFDKVRALVDAVHVESFLEDGTVAPAEEPERAGRRALEAFDSPEAQDEWTQQLIDWLRDLFGEPEAPPADLLAMATSSTDGFKAVLTSEGEGEGMPSEADRTDHQPTQGDRSMSNDSNPASRAELLGLREHLERLDGENKSLRERVEVRELQDKIADRFREARLSPPQGDKLDEIVRTARASADPDHIVDLYLKAANVPPAGTATDPNERTARGGEPETQGEAIAAEKEALVAERGAPTEPAERKSLHAEACLRAGRKHPHLFTPGLS